MICDLRIFLYNVATQKRLDVGNYAFALLFPLRLVYGKIRGPIFLWFTFFKNLVIANRKSYCFLRKTVIKYNIKIFRSIYENTL